MSRYIDINHYLSYQRFIYYLTGGRGIGKTYGTQKMLIKHFLNNGFQFLWVRRYKTEVKNQKQGFFNKVKSEFNDTEFNVKGDECYINKKLAGCFVALTAGVVNKGNSKLNNIKYLVFDEYVADSSDVYHSYLPNEMRKLFDVIETFGRTEDIICIFLSNNYSQVNPLCNMFNINFDKSNIYKTDLIYAEQIPTPEEFKEIKTDTKFAKLIKRYDVDYFNYNLDNTSFADNNNFISKRLRNSIQKYNIIIDKKQYKVYKGRNEKGEINFFISNKGDESNSRLKYSFDITDVEAIFLDRENIAMIKPLITSLKKNKTFFETQEIKFIFLEKLKKYLF